MSPEALNALEAVAKTAAKHTRSVPWEHLDDEYTNVQAMIVSGKPCTIAETDTQDLLPRVAGCALAAHIAAFDPPTALELIAEIRTVAADRDRWVTRMKLLESRIASAKSALEGPKLVNIHEDYDDPEDEIPCRECGEVGCMGISCTDDEPVTDLDDETDEEQRA